MSEKDASREHLRTDVAHVYILKKPMETRG